MIFTSKKTAQSHYAGSLQLKKYNYGEYNKDKSSVNVFTKPANLDYAGDIVEELPSIDKKILQAWLEDHQGKFSDEFPGKLFEFVFERNIRADISHHDAHLIACCLNFVKEEIINQNNS